MDIWAIVGEVIEKSCMLCCGLVAVIGTLFATVVSLYFKKKFV